MPTLPALQTRLPSSLSGSDDLVLRLEQAIERAQNAADPTEGKHIVALIRDTAELLYSIAEMDGIVDQHEADAEQIRERLTGEKFCEHRARHLRGRLKQHRALAARRRVSAIMMAHQVMMNLRLIEETPFETPEG